MRARNWSFYLYAQVLFVATIAAAALISGCNCDPGPENLKLGTLATDQPSNTLIFDDIELNKAKVKSFILYNDGGQDLTISGMDLVDNQGDVFKVIDPPATPFTLAPGKDNGKKIQVEFLPKQASSYTARIRIASADADNVNENGEFFVKLRHNILSADPQWDCSGGTLEFGSVEKGKSETKECVLTNRGNADFTVEKATYKKEKGGQKVDFEWVSPKFPFTVKSGDKKGVVVKIKYTPSDYPPREDQGAFVFESNILVERDEDKPRIKVVGLTAVALVELVPKYPDCTDDAACRRIDTRLRCVKDEFTGSNLCRQPEGQTPVIKFPLTSKGKVTRRTFFIRSIGDKPLQVDDVVFDGNTSQDFKLVTSGVSFPLTLNPKEEKEITVEYTPSDDQEDTGQAIVSSNAGNKPKAPVILEAASRGCNVEVQPRKVSFGGAVGLTKQINIVNRGNESCIINKVYLKSGNSEPFSLLPQPQADQTLVPNGSFSFLVTLKPKDGQTAKDFIVVESTDPDEPTIEVELDAPPIVGDACQLEAAPQTVNFGLVPVGRSRKSSVTIKNKGWGECTVTSLNVVGTDPTNNNSFALSTAVSTPLQITAGSTVRLDINYTPPAERSGYEGELRIESNDSKQPTFVVKLVGSSGTLCLEVLPPNLDFGSTKFGCATPKNTVEVFNLGASNCKSSIIVTGIRLTQNPNQEFRINSAPTFPQTLTNGQSVRIELSYKAKDLGVDTATLEISNDVIGQSPVPVPLIGEGVETSDQKDVFKQLKRPLTDIAFVVDDSGSMGDEQANLATNFQAFINWAVRLNVDYQIMVTTTDVTKSGALAPGCARGNPKIVTPNTPNPVLAFQNNVKVGTRGSGLEKGLEAAYRMLIPPASTGCNKGFNRKDASLSIIFVSDEADGSGQTVQFYVSFFKALKGLRNLNLIRASAIVGPPPSGCRSAGQGNAGGAPRYWEVAKQLQGIQAPICSNWAPTLSNLGSITFGYRTQFFLTRAADPTTIKVKVNGQTVKEDPQDGWSYDNTNNSVNFSKNAVPAPGATVQVEYKAICLP